MNRELQEAFRNFRTCAEDAPEGTYDEAKRLNTLIGETATTLMRELHASDLRADACDLIFGVEVAIYDYVRRSNPESTLFPVAEGFGAAMDTPARDRVLAQAEDSARFFRDFFAPLRGRTLQHPA